MFRRTDSVAVQHGDVPGPLGSRRGPRGPVLGPSGHEAIVRNGGPRSTGGADIQALRTLQVNLAAKTVTEALERERAGAITPLNHPSGSHGSVPLGLHDL